MDDTSPQGKDRHRDLLMVRSNEERFKMGVSMCQTARRVGRSSLPDDLEPTERRVQFFLLYYGNELDPNLRDEIGAALRSHDPGSA